MPETCIIFDVDQTLATGVVPAHMAFYNEKLGLGMTREEIQASESYPKTFDVPQIIAYRGPEDNRNVAAEQRFQAARAEIRTSEPVHLNLSSIPGSIQAVRKLRESQGVTFGGYYSVRPTELTACIPN